MCPWIETLGFCPFDVVSTAWHWIQRLFG